MPAILKLPPEIFPLVSSHLPVQLSPATLFALAGTCSRVYACVRPILYRKIIIKDEDHALQALERIAADTALTLMIREFHLRLDLSSEIQKERRDTTVLTRLQEVIENRSLANLNFFRLVLLKFDLPDRNELVLNEQYFLPRGFWASLRSFCPNLRGVCVDGVDSPKDRWVNNPEFYDLQDFSGLSTLTLKFNYSFPSAAYSAKLCQNLINIASSLETLTLFFNGVGCQEAGPLFSNTFPRLKSISISGVNLDGSSTEEAPGFWTRHPQLERVNIYTGHTTGWFSDTVENSILPNLKHLMAKYEDIRAFSSRLGQLERLSISSSNNHEIPYLLRFVIPNGLPNLRSLEIQQEPCTDIDSNDEGAMWYETEEGEVRKEKDSKAGKTVKKRRKAAKTVNKRSKAAKTVDSSYLRSIMRGAPNLEELCVHSFRLFMDELIRIAPVLGQFKFLERFYFWAFEGDQRTTDATDHNDFRMECRLLGYWCSSLKTVTAVHPLESGPYLRGKIIRGADGSVDDVVLGYGFGMEFTGDDDDPFPVNKLP